MALSSMEIKCYCNHSYLVLVLFRQDGQYLVLLHSVIFELFSFFLFLAGKFFIALYDMLIKMQIVKLP